ncbi:ArsR/SmtB family transcription factor [Halobacterium sp. MBLA0001]
MTANRLLPGSASVDAGDGSEVVHIREDAADDVFDALGSRTAREILSALYEEPDTASGVADRVDTSLQNASYHIENLVEADLLEVADTWYSAQGREMSVYAPASDTLVLFAADSGQSPSLRSRLAGLLGVLGALGVVSVAVQRLLAGGTPRPGARMRVASERVTQAAENTTEPGVIDRIGHAVTATLQTLPPGVVFFAGGVFVLAMVGAYAWYQS